MKKSSNMLKRGLVLLLTAALIIGSIDSSTIASLAAELPQTGDGMPEEVTPQETRKENTEETEEVITGELVDLSEVVTSGYEVSLFGLADGTIDSTGGNHEKWIDRVDLPEYAKTLYEKLAEASDHDGTDDVLISDNAFSQESATEINYSGGDKDVFHAIKVVTLEGADATMEQRYYAYQCIQAAYDAFDRDHPEVFWLSGETKALTIATSTGSGVTYTVYFVTKLFDGSFNGSFDIRKAEYQSESAISTGIEACNTAVNTILAGITAAEPADQITKMNEWLTTNNEYNTIIAGGGSTADPDSWECISALTGRTGEEGPVCEGYARALKVLCDAKDIPCVLVDGHARNSIGSAGEPHMWNYVKVDGSWYAVDVTWNDPVGGNSGAVSGVETTDWLLVGGDTEIYSMRFLESHPVTNVASYGGAAFTNGPELSAKKYVNTGKKTPVIAKKPTVTVTYGDTVKDTDLKGGRATVNGVEIEGAFSWDSSVTSYGNAGINSLKAVFTPADTSKYSVVSDIEITVTVESKILAADEYTIVVSPDSYSYTGSAVIPTEVKVLFGGIEIPAGEYTLSYSDNNAPGKAKVTVSDKEAGNYELVQKTAEYIITGNGSLTNKASGGYKTSFTYTGQSIAAPTAGNFETTNTGAEMTFTWYSGTAVNEANRMTAMPKNVGDYVLLVKAAATEIYSEASLQLSVKIQYLPFTGTIHYNGEAVEKTSYGTAVSITAPGYTVSDSLTGSFSDSYRILAPASDGQVSRELYFKNNAGEITDKQNVTVDFDVTAPEGEIKLGAKLWQSFLSSITFGRYKVTDNRVTITGTDTKSGVSKTEYVIVTGDTVYTDVNSLTEAALTWTEYQAGSKPTISANTKSIVYARITDGVGNVTYLSSGGILLDNTAPVISSLSVSEAKDREVKVTGSVNEACKYYYVVLPAAAAVPAAKDIIATVDHSAIGAAGGTVIAGVAAMGSGSVTDAELSAGSAAFAMTADGLSPNTEYKLYAAAVDRVLDISSSADGTESGNVSTAASAEFTTLTAAITGSVAVTGDAVYHETLTATVSGTAADSGALSYQWYRGEELSSEAAIAGATASTYILTQDDIGKKIWVKVTAANCSGQLTSAATATVEKAACPTANVPTNGQVNDTIETDTFTFTGKAGVVYEYSLNGGTDWTALAPLTGTTGTVPVGNIACAPGKVQVRAKETDIYKSSDAISNSTAFTATLEGSVSLNGTAKYGMTLTAAVTGQQKNAVLNYCFKAGGAILQNGASNSYQIQGSDIGKNITVEVTAEGYTGMLVPSGTAETVAPRSITITAKAQTITYGDSISGTTNDITISGDGLAAGDQLTGITLQASAKNVYDINKKITPSGAVVAVSGNTDVTAYYAITYQENTLTINRRSLEGAQAALNVPSEGYTYDGTEKKPAVAVVLNGKALTEGTAETSDYKVVYENNVNAGEDTAKVKIIAPDGGNYSGSITKTFTISPKALTAVLAVANKAYDGTNAAAVTASVATGVAGDDLTITGVKGTFADKNAGENKTVTIDSSAMSVAASAGTITVPENYKITIPGTTTATIHRRPVHVFAEAKSKTYGDPDPKFTYRVSTDSDSLGLVNGETLTGMLSRDTGENVKAGGYAITQGTLSNENNVNYEISYTGAVLTIKKADYILNVSETQQVVNGVGTFREPTATGVNQEAVPGTLTYTCEGVEKTYTELKDLLAQKASGDSVTINYLFRTSDSNYKDVTDAGTSGIITCQIVDIVFLAGTETASSANAVTILKSEPVYGDTWAEILKLNELTAKVGAYEDRDQSHFTLDVTGTPATGTQTYRVLYSGTLGGKTFENTLVCMGTIEIHPKSLAAAEVTLGTEAYTYDGTAKTPGVTVKLDGLTLTGMDYTVEYADNINAGTQAKVIVTGIGNYGTGTESDKITKTFTISPKPVTAAVTASAKTYDGTTAATVTATVPEGLIGEDALTITGLTGTFADKNAGENKTVAVDKTGMSVTAGTGTVTGNYEITVPGTAIAAIHRRPVTVTADAKSKTYGTVDPEFTYHTAAASGDTGLIAGESLTGALSRAEGEDVKEGGYLIGQGTLTNENNPNYSITFVNTGITLTILPRTLTWDTSKLYAVDREGAVPAGNQASLYGSLKVSGILEADKETAVFTCPAEKLSGVYAVTDAGKQDVSLAWASGEVTLSGSKAGNYSLPSALPTIKGTINEVVYRDIDDSAYRLKVENGISAKLDGEELNTPDKIYGKLYGKLKEKITGLAEKDMAAYDMILQREVSPGNFEDVSDAADFPAEGITISIRYSDMGAVGQNTHNFVVAHMFTTTIDGQHHAGDIEYPAVTKTAEGIRFKVTSLSPIAVGWTPVPSSGDNGSSSGGSNSGGSSSGSTSSSQAAASAGAATGDLAPAAEYAVLSLAALGGMLSVFVRKGRRKES